MKRNLLITSCSVVEWFDFLIFIYLSSYISDYFLPPYLPQGEKNFIMLALMLTPYILRPLGGFIFGYLADRPHKKKSGYNLDRSHTLLITVFLMTISTVVIIFIPSYETFGIYSVILLLLSRAVQAFSIGGEFIVSIVMLFEGSSPSKRFLTTSLANISSIVGSLLGVLFVTLLLHAFSSEEISSGYWKVPFGLTSVLFILVWYIRKIKLNIRVSNSDVKNNSFSKVLKAPNVKKNLIALFFYLVFGAVAFYFFVVMSKKILLATGASSSTSTLITSLGLLSLLISIPFAANLADNMDLKNFLTDKKIKGTKAIQLQKISIVLTILFSILYKYVLLQKIFILSVICQIILGGILSLYLGLLPGFITLVAPKALRCSFLGLTYNLALSIFGVLTPLLIVLLLRYNNYGDILYLILAGILSFIALNFLKGVKNDLT